MSPSVAIAGGRRAAIRPFRDDDEPGVVELYREVWPDAFAATMRTAWRWKYREHPEGDGAGRCLVLDDGDGIVGFLGVMPARLEIRGETVRGAWLADLMIAPAARGRAGLALARAMLEREPLALGSAGPTIRRFWTKMTGRDDIVVARLTRVRRRFGVKGAALRAAGALSRLGRGGGGGDRAAVRIAEVDPASVAAGDVAARRAAAGYEARAHRDAAFLRWRFGRCPFARHRLFVAADDDGPRGYLAVRDDGDRATIVDGLCARDDVAAWSALLDAAVDAARRAGAAGVEALAPADGGLATALAGAGFAPPVRRTSEFCVIGRATDERLADTLFGRPSAWFFTLADSDFGMQ